MENITELETQRTIFILCIVNVLMNGFALNLFIGIITFIIVGLTFISVDVKMKKRNRNNNPPTNPNYSNENQEQVVPQLPTESNPNVNSKSNEV